MRHKKHASKFIDHNLITDYQILIIYDLSISDTTGHQMTIYFPTSPNVCFVGCSRF